MSKRESHFAPSSAAQTPKGLSGFVSSRNNSFSVVVTVPVAAVLYVIVEVLGGMNGGEPGLVVVLLAPSMTDKSTHFADPSA
jgi:hypothetical protein